MNLSAVIPSSRIAVVANAQSKKTALETISKTLAEGDSKRQDAIFDALLGRERLGSTGLGDGVAIPHGRINGISEPMGCLVKLDESVDFEAADGKNVDLLAGLVVPADCTEEHLQVLANVARLFSNSDFTTAARQTTDSAALAELLAANS
ncbi:MAG: PTS sugar transporter subunit IIA [Gammaproteobacteria bacterium]|nr:PTS sugar transporter subunit IIA [Gammaproteobacteria bacterium]